MKILNNYYDCTGCAICAEICPVECIRMKDDKEGFPYPSINDDKCTQCGLCIEYCPVVNPPEKNDPIDSFAAYSNDYSVRLESSSGGIFTEIANSILAHNGYICAAGYDDKFNVVHKIIHSQDEIRELTGSKYVQSKLNNVNSKIIELLEKGEQLLFVGTPCQVAGIRKMLNDEYDNIILVDFICHGVPSPAVWKRYLRDNYCIENIKSISFRDKSKGWRTFSMKVQTGDSIITESLNENLYLKGFLQNLYLRPSCYKCQFKGISRMSDITMGDLWGVENIEPELDDDTGISIVIVNSNKGSILIDSVLKNITKKEINYHNALSYNSAAEQSVPINSNRSTFFNDFTKGAVSINSIIKKYTRVSTITKMRRKLSVLKNYFIR